MTGWGIIGPGTIASNFAEGLRDCPNAHLVAVAGRSPARAGAFAARFGVKSYASPAALLADPLVDAVYAAAPNAAHCGIGILALASGKAVLCEKPAGLNTGDVAKMVAAARQAGLFWMEGYMYRFHRQIARMIEVIQSGEIGAPVHLRAAFGFAADETAPADLWNADAGGGAIMDVGGYPMSLSRLVAGVAVGAPFAEPVTVQAAAAARRGNVETTATAKLHFANGFTASIATSISEEMNNSATLTCTKGKIVLIDPWTPGRGAAPSDTDMHIETSAGVCIETIRDPRQLFGIEAEAASAAIAQAREEPVWPAMGQEESLGQARALEHWRAAVAVQDRDVYVALTGSAYGP